MGQKRYRKNKGDTCFERALRNVEYRQDHSRGRSNEKRGRNE